MIYSEAKAKAEALGAEVERTGKILGAFPKGAMNLTPDAVRATPEFRTAKAEYDRAFAALRAFNQSFVKQFAKEIRADHKARAKCAATSGGE